MALHAIESIAGALVLAWIPCRLAQGQTEFSTFIGDGASSYQVVRIRTDAARNTYLAGNRSSGSLSELFVTKLDASGNITLFTTFSGKGVDRVADLAIDAAGNMYLAGGTSSTLFPLRGPLQSVPGPGFLVKLSADGTEILYSTYFPAAIAALALDSAGNMYVTGTTNSSTFPVTAGMPAGPPDARFYGAFLTKIAAAGDHVVYSGVLVGSGKNCGYGSSCFLSTRSTAGVAIAVDAAGNAYVAGDTDTYDLPTTAGAMAPQGTGAFVAKVNASGNGLAYLTYIGSTYYPLAPNTNPANTATGIAVDAAGSAYVVGRTFDPNFPATAGAIQATYSGPAYPSGTEADFALPPADTFAMKLKADGSGAVWATYLGGPGAENANSIAVDSAGVVWLTGTTTSGAFLSGSGGDFIAGLSASGTTLAYGARFPAGSVSQAVAIDSAGVVHAAGPAGLVSAIAPGQTSTARIFGVANSAFAPMVGGEVTEGLISIYGSHLGPAVGVSAPAGAKLPTTLAGVTAGGLPLLYVSDTQINAVWGSYSGVTDLRVENNSATSLDFPVISGGGAAPQIFRSASGAAAAVNQDGSINAPDHPAPPGSVVALWVTGILLPGSTYDGTIATAAKDYGCCEVWAGQPLNVWYAGNAPGTPLGVVQINFQIPANASGSLSVQVEFAESYSTQPRFT